MDNTNESNIFSKIRIGHLTLKNRVLMGPIVTGLEKEKRLDELASFYEERARGGVSLITVGDFRSRF